MHIAMLDEYVDVFYMKIVATAPVHCYMHGYAHNLLWQESMI